MSDLRHIRPLGDRVVLRELPREERIGSIVIPKTADARGATRRAEVLAVGPGKLTPEGRRIEPRVKTGDRILFGKYSGSEITIDDEIDDE